MMKWMATIVSPRSSRGAEERPNLDDGDRMMIDLVIAEVESAVIRFETKQEMQRSERSLRERIPDYSWLATDSSARHRKYLSMTERSRVESACCMVIASEWSTLLATWRSRLQTVNEREDIFDAFSTAVYDIIASRPRSNTLTEVLINYIRKGRSLNAVRSHFSFIKATIHFVC
ncbi:unnamed protein product [Anisakis simplex]|uniref:Uncharacterized protein n=1 Tax=Anisakis simplex TaxID=6269 RepID=A0A0M3K8W1_ANISI|nr:unnamed protein product [Anisakis simplex]